MYQANFVVLGNIIISPNIGESENFKLLIKSPQQSRQRQQRYRESVLYTIRRSRSGSRPRQLTDLMHALDDYAVRKKSSPTIVWIPGHLGIQGNETADDLCKRALHHDAVDIPTTLEYREARTIYRDFFLRKWQAEWT